MKVMPAIAWPEGKQSALCLTVDIDAETMWTSVDADNHRRPFIMGQSDYEIDVGIPLILDLLERRHISTTFFVPGSVAQAHSETVSDIARAGHEIACHGWLHESTDGFSRTDETALIKRSTDAITDIVGSRPVGYRAGLADVNPRRGGSFTNLAISTPATCRPVSGRTITTFQERTWWRSAARDDGRRSVLSHSAQASQLPSVHPAERGGRDMARRIQGDSTHWAVSPSSSFIPSSSEDLRGCEILEELIDLAESLGNVWIPTMREVGELCVATLPHNDKRYRDTPNR